MKILHVSETAWGGCGTYLNEMIPLQIRSLGRANVKVIAPHEHLGHLSIDPDFIIPFHRTGRLLGPLFLAISFLRTVRQFRPDVIHAHSTFAGAVVRLMGMFLWRRPTIIYCPHGWAFEIDHAKPVRSIIASAEKLFSRLCDKVIAISHAERRQAESIGIDAAKLVVILNGVAAEIHEEAAVWDDNKLRVLFVGRLDRQKGLDILLEAVRSLDHVLTVRVVGEKVTARTDQHLALPHVEYFGWLRQEDVSRQMNACDVLVVPSRWEGFGLVAIEAMRAGKAVIASAVGGLQEIVVSGKTGLLVSPEQPNALRDALLSRTREEFMHMGRAGKKVFLGSYSSEQTHNRLMKLYASLLNTVNEVAVIDEHLAGEVISVPSE